MDADGAIADKRYTLKPLIIFYYDGELTPLPGVVLAIWASLDCALTMMHTRVAAALKISGQDLMQRQALRKVFIYFNTNQRRVKQ